PGNGEQLGSSVIALKDSETGPPLALWGGNGSTVGRTAALSLVAARRMAKPDSRVVAFIGSGLQARSHLDALAEYFPLTDIRLFGRGRPNIDALCALAARHGINAHVADTPADAMRGADIVVSSITRVPGAEPFADVADIAPGAFAALVDLARPWHPAGLATLEKIIIDDRAQEATMKDPMVPLDGVTGDLADLVLGRVDMRVAAAARTAFIFRGYALGDFALAALAYEAASAEFV
ncbi:MAG: ornithine cyclodeaminase family protein, partial [Hyphomicrobiaceae bacterium]